MKGTMSRELEIILADPEGRRKLRSLLTDKGTGTIVVGKQTFRIDRVSSQPQRMDTKAPTKLGKRGIPA